MDQAKAVHLYNLAHFGPFGAILSRHAVVLDEFAYENGLCLPQGFTHCAGCGVVSVPGLTSTSRIKYTQKRAKALRTRALHIVCLACGHKDVHTTLTNRKRAGTLPAATGEKKKKKKRSELSAMLAEKKQAETKTSLNLMDFLQ